MRTLDGASTRSVMGSRVLKSLREGQPRQVVEGLVVAAADEPLSADVDTVDGQRQRRQHLFDVELAGCQVAVEPHGALGRRRRRRQRAPAPQAAALGRRQQVVAAVRMETNARQAALRSGQHRHRHFGLPHVVDDQRTVVAAHGHHVTLMKAKFSSHATIGQLGHEHNMEKRKRNFLFNTYVVISRLAKHKNERKNLFQCQLVILSHHVCY